MYYAEENGLIIKYAVNVDIDALQALRVEIINNCSKIVPYKIDDATDFVRDNKNDTSNHIHNYSEQVVGTFTWGDKETDIYEVKFDYYEFPAIISYIDAVLRGDYSVLYRVFDPIMSLQMKSNKKCFFAKEFMMEFNYYPLVQQCISLTEIARISKDDIIKIRDFFDASPNLMEEIIKR